MATSPGRATREGQILLRDMVDSLPEESSAGQRFVRPDEPIRVRAWVSQRQSGTYEVDAVALAWTSNQVEIAFSDKHGRRGSAWVWANAVSRA